jgi:hypothetical protein
MLLIDKKLLDQTTEKAKTSPGLRMMVIHGFIKKLKTYIK